MKEISVAQVAQKSDEAGCLTDGRFFVVGDALIEVYSADDSTFVSIHSGITEGGIFNPSYGADLAAHYNTQNPDKVFEFSSVGQANAFVIGYIGSALKVFE